MAKETKHPVNYSLSSPRFGKLKLFCYPPARPGVLPRPSSLPVGPLHSGRHDHQSRLDRRDHSDWRDPTVTALTAADAVMDGSAGVQLPMMAVIAVVAGPAYPTGA